MARSPFVAFILLQPALEFGDAKELLLESGGDDLPGRFWKIVDEVRVGQVGSELFRRSAIREAGTQVEEGGFLE